MRRLGSPLPLLPLPQSRRPSFFPSLPRSTRPIRLWHWGHCSPSCVGLNISPPLAGAISTGPSPIWPLLRIPFDKGDWGRGGIESNGYLNAIWMAFNCKHTPPLLVRDIRGGGGPRGARFRFTTRLKIDLRVFHEAVFGVFFSEVRGFIIPPTRVGSYVLR